MSPLRSEVSTSPATPSNVSGLPHIMTANVVAAAANDDRATSKRSMLVQRRKRWARRNAH